MFMKKKSNQKTWKRLTNQLGMSLLEVMIAIGIVAVVGGYIVKKVSDRAEQADIEQTRGIITDLEGDIKFYKRKKQDYPTTDVGLQALVDSGILEEVPLDAWNNEINYESPGTHGDNKFEIWSNGPDEEPDTKDDIVSWKQADE